MVDTLLRASVESAVLVVLVWLLIRAVPTLSAGARAMLWWCAAAKFVVALAWTAPIEIPLLPARAAGATEVAPYENPIGATEVAPYEYTIGDSAAAPQAHAPAGEANPRWRGPRERAETALLVVWAGGLLVAFGMLAWCWHRTVALVRRASAAPSDIDALAGELAAALGLRRAPRVRMSPEVESPVVAGFARPVVLLPLRFTDLSIRHQRLSLCHELMHVARGDLWMGCVPALAERVFFFHPLARLAAREYVFWRESACDAAVLEALGAEPHEYGRLLIDLGISAPRASFAAAGASWSFKALKRRIHMLGHLSRASRSRTSRLAAATAVLLALGAWVPLRLVARPSFPELQTPAAQASATSAEASLDAQVEPPARPAPPRPPVPARRAAQPETRDLAYVLFLGGDGERTHMSGSRADIERARSVRKGNESLLWFRNASGEFVVRDPAILQQVEQVWKPVGELGAKQGQLGAQQGALGSKMGELGAKQGEIGAQQGHLGARQAAIGAQQTVIGAKQAAIGAKQAELAAREWEASEAQRKEIDTGQRELDRQMRALDEEMKKLNAPMRALDEEMKALGARMQEFEKPMRDLGAQMEALGGQMETLGREMERASARAQTQMRELLDRAIASGAAKSVVSSK
jgi:beta-lactamase regulating signal transducer with metallopeptidase domain